jgi:hypothetical protein
MPENVRDLMPPAPQGAPNHSRGEILVPSQPATGVGRSARRDRTH